MKVDVAHQLLYSALLCFNEPSNFNLPTETEMIELIKSTQEHLEKEDFVIILNGKWVIVGDIHGDVFSLIRMFTTLGYPPETKYLFLGDYVDRGHNSIEVMIILMALKVLYNDSICLLRGNHESRSMTMSYGFYEECLNKMNEQVYEEFINLFDQLPIVALINGKIFCTHGGISKRVNDFVDIFGYSKPKDSDKPKKKMIVHDLLWSDPCNAIDYFDQSDRGANTFVFGEKALDDFLNENQFSCIIRGHQNCSNGYDKPFDNDKCWTVFSSADYCQTWNQAAVLIVDDGFVDEVVVFDPVCENDKKNEKVIFPYWLIVNEISMTSQLDPGFVDDDLVLGEYSCDFLADYVSM